MTMNTATAEPVTVNGVDVDCLQEIIGTIEQDATFAKTQFRARNKWLGGGLNRSEIKGFFAAGCEDTTRTAAFELHADEPLVLTGQDVAPNPVEFILHALAGCLTTTLVYHAAVRGIGCASIQVRGAECSTGKPASRARRLCAEVHTWQGVACHWTPACRGPRRHPTPRGNTTADFKCVAHTAVHSQAATLLWVVRHRSGHTVASLSVYARVGVADLSRQAMATPQPNFGNNQV